MRKYTARKAGKKAKRNIELEKTIERSEAKSRKYAIKAKNNPPCSHDRQKKRRRAGIKVSRGFICGYCEPQGDYFANRFHGSFQFLTFGQFCEWGQP